MKELFELYALREENSILRIENEELRQKWYEASELAFQQAITSDKMKLDLIISGCLVKPEAK